MNLVASPFLLFAMLSFFSVATQGVDTWSHLFYNLTPLNLIQNGFNKKVISIATNPESFEYHYYLAIVPWLKVAVISVIMAFIVRLISYYLIYQVCFACIREKNPAIVVTFLFMVPVAISAHGLNPNGLWGPPVLFPAILSTFFILIGLLLFLSTGEYNDLENKARKKGIGFFHVYFEYLVHP